MFGASITRRSDDPLDVSDYNVQGKFRNSFIRTVLDWTPARKLPKLRRKYVVEKYEKS